MPEYRLIHVDHYMSKPEAPFDDLRSEATGKLASKVPVIRIFGADKHGRKICIHVHGFYPYIAVQNRDPTDPGQASKFVTDVEKAIADVAQYQSSRPGPSNERPQQDQHNHHQQQQLPQNEHADDLQNQEEQVLRSRIQQERRPMSIVTGDQRSPIHRLETIKAYNYYGYHHKAEEFFKLHIYNPRMIKQLALILEEGKVQGRFVPVFWAHLPYILLFFIDNNLRGMQFIDVDQLYWRKDKAPGEQQEQQRSPNASVNRSTTLDNETQLLSSDIEPTSTCELEADIRFEWILNRQKFGSKGNDDALRELWLDDQEASQSQSRKIADPKLPLFELERNYIEQLCEAYGINVPKLTLEPTRPRPLSPGDDLFSDDDDDLLRSLSTLQPSVSQPNLRQQNPTPPGKETKRRYSDNSMIDGASVICSTLATSKPGSQHSTGSSRETVNHEYQFLSLISMELHTTTRGRLRPDPAFDPIEAVFYCVRNDVPDTSLLPGQSLGMILTDPFVDFNLDISRVSSPTVPGSASSNVGNVSFIQKIRSLLYRTGMSMKDVKIDIVNSEMELIIKLVDVVKLHDPEILLGYEMEQLSWGYLLERSNILNISVSSALGRVSDVRISNNSRSVEANFVQPIMFTGRMVFSTWRIIKHEIHLNTCSYEKIHHHALGERVPCFSFETLTKWFNENRNRWRVIDYYMVRVVGQMRILDKFDLITKVSELARCYGTQFIDVITRGSQIGIESMMLRLAKFQHLYPLSPTVMQRHKMRAPEAIPLVMEPESNIYYDPVAVLDFASLYPSVVIAYNYCYSTCLGRVIDLESKNKHAFGCSQLHVEESEIKRLLETNSVHVSPCGIAFVKKNIRHGVLPKMLFELTTTRAMVKEQMKKNTKSVRPNRRLQRILEHRQHGLKMMANTTYGYAGASYTGRMPCVEIADSIVSKGRETLEKAIELVESRREWGAKVIYGDTDSIFIQFPGCDKDTAFKRAYEMVDAISEANPYPIKMKFEKIYQPCVLQTKKRYCGFKYEWPDQKKPEFEAKGIETVRRDCCPAAARMLEMALRIQFNTKDVEQVREYVQHQFVKIMSGKLSNIQDFIFARQYKPRDHDKKESVFVPAWQVSKRTLAVDPRAEPRVGERVPYVIVYGEPRTPLVHLAKTPMEMLDNLSYRINADYYIQKIICPTLNRIFCTLKVDTTAWYRAMPHRNIVHRSHYLVSQKNHNKCTGDGQSTMSQYFVPSHCPVCAKSIPVHEDICEECRGSVQSSVVRLTEEITRNQRKLFAYHQLCRACSSLERVGDSTNSHYNPCVSYDCENLFRYHQAKLDVSNSDYLSEVLKNLF